MPSIVLHFIYMFTGLQQLNTSSKETHTALIPLENNLPFLRTLVQWLPFQLFLQSPTTTYLRSRWIVVKSETSWICFVFWGGVLFWLLICTVCTRSKLVFWWISYIGDHCHLLNGSSMIVCLHVHFCSLPKVLWWCLFYSFQGHLPSEKQSCEMTHLVNCILCSLVTIHQLCCV